MGYHKIIINMIFQKFWSWENLKTRYIYTYVEIYIWKYLSQNVNNDYM